MGSFHRWGIWCSWESFQCSPELKPLEKTRADIDFRYADAVTGRWQITAGLISILKICTTSCCTYCRPDSNCTKKCRFRSLLAIFTFPLHIWRSNCPLALVPGRAKVRMLHKYQWCCTLTFNIQV